MNLKRGRSVIGETQKWQEKDNRYVWHAMSGYDPSTSTMIVEKGDGAWITDTDGNHYLDGMSGLWCVNVGYGREELAQAAYEQLKQMSFYPLMKSHLPAIELGEKLNQWLEDEYVFFYSNSARRPTRSHSRSRASTTSRMANPIGGSS